MEKWFDSSTEKSPATCIFASPGFSSFSAVLQRPRRYQQFGMVRDKGKNIDLSPFLAWLCSPCANFHLLIAAAVLDLKRKEIMNEEFGYWWHFTKAKALNWVTLFSEILQVVNRLSGNVDTDEILARAQSLLVQISRSLSTPPIIKQLLNLSD